MVRTDLRQRSSTLTKAKPIISFLIGVFQTDGTKSLNPPLQILTGELTLTGTVAVRPPEGALEGTLPAGQSPDELREVMAWPGRGGDWTGGRLTGGALRDTVTRLNGQTETNWTECRLNGRTLVDENND